MMNLILPNYQKLIIQSLNQTTLSVLSRMQFYLMLALKII